MKTPEIPANESERMNALNALNVLDTPIDERFERITRMVCRTLGVPIAAVSLVDHDRQWFKSIQGLEAAQTPREISFCGHAINSAGPLVINDALADERFHDNPLVVSDPSIRSYAGIPLANEEGQRLGTLCALDTSPREFTAEELELLADLAGMATTELMNLKLSDAHTQLVGELAQAQRAALIDSLTRLWNRGGAELLLEKEWKAAKRGDEPITIAILDIDHFKKINDQFGHPAGDAVLREISRTLMQNLRPLDTVARWGGEEFLIVLPNCAEDEADAVLDRLTTSVRQRDFETGKVTASIGACCCRPSELDEFEAIIEQADRGLYRAKAAGRDRVVFESPPD